MAPTTWREVAEDLREHLKQVYVDSKISLAQAVFWVRVVADNVRAAAVGQKSSGAFMYTFLVPVLKDTSKGNLSSGTRKYIELPKYIYDFDEDRGVHYVSYPDGPGLNQPRFTDKKFTRTTIEESELLYMNRFEKPEPSNPYWYRENNYIFFLGLETYGGAYLQIGLFITFDPLKEIDIDEPMDFPSELLDLFKRELLDLGRWALLFPRELQIDGSGEAPVGIPTNKIVSVNDQGGDRQRQEQ